MRTNRTHLRRQLAVLATAGGLALLAAACGDDTADGPQATTPASSSATEVPAASPPPTESPASLQITAQDYTFDGLPTEVAAGTQFRLANGSTTELHEMVAVRIADGDDRPLTEIVTNDLASLFATQPSFVLLATPGGEQISAVGDGVLSQPGRYAVVCMIPTGIDPTVYLTAAAQSGDGPPQVEGGGAPHIFNGMFGELTVTAG